VLRAPEPPRRLDILFLWGRNCPNCGIAKAEIARAPAWLRWPQVRWLQANVYDDPDLAILFGLHGIPVFLVFRSAHPSGRPVGRVTSWPGTEAFAAAIDRLLATPP